MKYPQLTKDNLIELYINKNMSIDEIANFLGIRNNIVGRYIRNFKIKKSREMIQAAIAKTTLKRYGSTCYFTSKEGIERIRNINLERYGVEKPFESKEIQNKVKNYFFNKYGGYSNMSCPETKRKIQDTFIRKYGSISPLGNKKVREKIEKTNLERYGTKNPIFSKEVKDKIEKTNLERYGESVPLRNKEIYNKTQQTVKNKYGVNSALEIPRVREATRLAYESGVAQQKAFETKKKNKSWTKSEPENQVLKLLQNKFGKEDVIHHKKPDNRYPHECDFYIISLDLYIEYQGYWKHGKEPYDETNSKHLQIVESWEEKAKEINFRGKSKNQYLSAIKVWTISDVQKRNDAKKNNLNWLEFFSIEEVENWLGVING